MTQLSFEKPTCESLANAGNVRREFEKSIRLDKKDFGAIEYLLRKGQRQLEMYSESGIRDIR